MPFPHPTKTLVLELYLNDRAPVAMGNIKTPGTNGKVKPKEGNYVLRELS